MAPPPSVYVATAAIHHATIGLPAPCGGRRRVAFCIHGERRELLLQLFSVTLGTIGLLLAEQNGFELVPAGLTAIFKNWQSVPPDSDKFGCRDRWVRRPPWCLYYRERSRFASLRTIHPHLSTRSSSQGLRERRSRPTSLENLFARAVHFLMGTPRRSRAIFFHDTICFHLRKSGCSTLSRKCRSFVIAIGKMSAELP